MRGDLSFFLILSLSHAQATVASRTKLGEFISKVGRIYSNFYNICHVWSVFCNFEVNGDMYKYLLKHNLWFSPNYKQKHAFYILITLQSSLSNNSVVIYLNIYKQMVF